jgi:hypothetical protein
MGMVAPVYYTVDMVRALPDDGNRYEVVHGELLVTPAPRPWHEVIVGRLHSALAAYLRGEPGGGARVRRSFGHLLGPGHPRRTGRVHCTPGAGSDPHLVAHDRPATRGGGAEPLDSPLRPRQAFTLELDELFRPI